MKTDSFTHLHVHSHYSLLDGACKLDNLISEVKKQGMSALALTDHGNLFGAIEFYQKAIKAGVKPIIGMEAYIAPNKLTDKKDIKGIKEASYHITLLAKSEKGYKNLIKLSTIAYREGFYYKPRIDKEILSKYSEGLIGLSGCPNSEFGHSCKSGQIDKALKVAGELKQIFSNNDFYLEIQNHGLDDEKKIVDGALEVGRKVGLKLVATNDIHYLRKEDSKSHDALLSINTGKLVKDDDRLKYPMPEFYVKSPAEMRMLFSEFPEAINSTLEIAEKCNIELSFDDLHFPRFIPPDGKTQSEMLRALCNDGMKRLYASITQQIVERLEYELSIIEKMGFVSYFLIVWDLIKSAKENGIPVGPGRGSSAGSLVAYTLGITGIDPLKYDLIFERFLNPSRKEMPDIDIDFCQEGRQRIIDYVKTKYGSDSVSQIITFGTMKAKQVIRDVGRVLDVDPRKVDYIAKRIPNVLNIKLSEAVEREPELANEIKNNKQIEELFDISHRLEGLYRHASTHASGIVISDKPLTEYVPLYVSGGDETTQFSADILQKIGLLKMDILGLETLTIIDMAVKLIERTKNIKIDIDALPLDDKETFSMLSAGNVKGVFQLETSRGMRDLIQKMKPDCFEDIIATIALFRPGPLQGGLVDQYINCKHGIEKPIYIHPTLEPILKETNGVIVYQEQVMRIANKLGGFSMADADVLRKSMGKKLHHIMAQYREQFIKGATKNGIDKETAEEIFERMQYFGGYGFNKSHATAYAMVSYQTAYLKAKYPVEYMTALMTSSRANIDKVAEYVEECRRLNITVLPPDINLSGIDFSVDGDKMCFGLGAIKNVGDKAIESILSARGKLGRFTSIYEFCENIDSRAVDRKVIESLIKCGAFDLLGFKRSQLMSVLDYAVSFGGIRQQDKKHGQLTFFEASESLSSIAGYPPLPSIEEWSEEQKISYEKEVIGFYMTNNPVARYQNIMGLLSTTTVDGVKDMKDGSDIIIGGIISDIRAHIIKTGKNRGGKYVTLKLIDLTGSCECVLFASDIERNKHILQEDLVCFIVGKIDLRREEPSIKVNQVVPMDNAKEFFVGNITISISTPGLAEDTIMELKDMLKLHPGECPVFFEIMSTDGNKAIVKTGNEYFVTPSDKFVKEIDRILGVGHISFKWKGKVDSSKAIRR